MKAICDAKKKKHKWATDLMQGTKIELKIDQHIVLLKYSLNDNETYADHHSIVRIVIVGIECVWKTLSLENFKLKWPTFTRKI